MAKSGGGSVENVDPDFVYNVSDTLLSLRNRGKPITDAERIERISMYLDACRDVGMRPGVEGLCMALHISRQTLNKWEHGLNCSQELSEAVKMAKQYIVAVLEEIGLSNKVNPATWIFALKNWADWRDQPEQEVIEHRPTFRTKEEILACYSPELVEMCERNEEL